MKEDGELIKLGNDNSDDLKDLEIPLDIKVRELKSILLKILDQPFFFDVNINDSPVQDLIDKSLNKPINLTYNPHVFNLYVNDSLGDIDLIVKGLKSD
jgi:hypothetical protein